MADIVGNIYQVPKTVSETGYIKIVGDQRHVSSAHSKWKILACTCDPQTKKVIGSAFEVTEDELMTWKGLQDYEFIVNSERSYG